MNIDITVSRDVERSGRVRQLEGMFDVPPQEKISIAWKGELPIERDPWSIGLIVGPSGSGKSTILREAFGAPFRLEWSNRAVINDFAADLPMEEIAAVCQAVGFNTIPAWMRPFGVLSNGEQFRVEIARRLVESTGIVTIDEFTSVVDRQVAKIAAHAVQKYVRKRSLQLVAATCHYDVIDWLQPDWTLDPTTMQYTRRSLQRRPPIAVEIGRVPTAAWARFAPFHYMSASLNKSARCFGLWADGTLAAFAAILYRPGSTCRNVFGVSRVVTLPDWQGLGLAFVLVDAVASAYAAVGRRMHHYPAHPSFIRGMDRSKNWALLKRPGTFTKRQSATTSLSRSDAFGGRPCATFVYCGERMDKEAARALLGDTKKADKRARSVAPYRRGWGA